MSKMSYIIFHFECKSAAVVNFLSNALVDSVFINGKKVNEEVRHSGMEADLLAHSESGSL